MSGLAKDADSIAAAGSVPLTAPTALLLEECGEWSTTGCYCQEPHPGPPAELQHSHTHSAAAVAAVPGTADVATPAKTVPLGPRLASPALH